MFHLIESWSEVELYSKCTMVCSRLLLALSYPYYIAPLVDGLMSCSGFAAISIAAVSLPNFVHYSSERYYINAPARSKAIILWRLGSNLFRYSRQYSLALIHVYCLSIANNNHNFELQSHRRSSYIVNINIHVHRSLSNSLGHYRTILRCLLTHSSLEDLEHKSS